VFIDAQTPRRLTALTRSNTSIDSSAASHGGTMIPALLNAMSSRPNVATVCSTSAATSASSATSQRTPMTLYPSAVSCSAAALTRSAFTSARATAAPALANASAVTSPIPEAAPVTRATCPVKS
jgi:hypothetical protein